MCVKTGRCTRVCASRVVLDVEAAAEVREAEQGHVLAKPLQERVQAGAHTHIVVQLNLGFSKAESNLTVPQEVFVLGRLAASDFWLAATCQPGEDYFICPRLPRVHCVS